MTKRVNWNKTLEDWEPSGKAERILQPEKIMQIVMSLEYIYEKLVFDETITSTRKDRDYFNEDWSIRKEEEVFKHLAEQLEKHKKVYRAMKDQYPSRHEIPSCYEFPFYREGQTKIRYVKILYKRGSTIDEPEEVKLISYHESNKGGKSTEVIFYE